MSRRTKAKELFDNSNIENTPMHWSIWKRAFDAGFDYAERPIIMSEEDAKIFSDAIENPPGLNERLKKAVEKYNKFIRNEK